MRENIFSEELRNAGDSFAAEDQLISNHERRERLTEFARRNNYKKLWRKNCKLKAANKILRKENAQLKAENEALKQKRTPREEEQYRNPLTEDGMGTEHLSIVGDKSTQSTVKEEKTFVKKMGEIFLSNLPKLLNTAVKSLIGVFIGCIPVWFGRRAGGSCT